MLTQRYRFHCKHLQLFVILTSIIAFMFLWNGLHSVHLGLCISHASPVLIIIMVSIIIIDKSDSSSWLATVRMYVPLNKCVDRYGLCPCSAPMSSCPHARITQQCLHHCCKLLSEPPMFCSCSPIWGVLQRHDINVNVSPNASWQDVKIQEQSNPLS